MTRSSIVLFHRRRERRLVAVVAAVYSHKQVQAVEVVEVVDLQNNHSYSSSSDHNYTEKNTNQGGRSRR
jgi:hypothetical protein